MRTDRSHARNKRLRRLRESPDDSLRELRPHAERREKTSKLSSAWAHLLLLVLIVLVLALLQPDALGGNWFWAEVAAAMIGVAIAYYDTERRRNLRAQILEVVEREGPLTREEIAEFVGANDNTAFRRLVMRMRRRGLLRHTTDGYAAT